MAITRTPIIDDDGSGTTGTVIDNAWKQELYNQIDGVVTSNTASVVTVTNGGSNVFDVALPGPRPFHYVRVYATSADITLRSVTTGRQGDLLLVDNIGTFNVWLSHAGAAAGGYSPFTNRVTSMATPLAPGGGAMYVYDDTARHWFLVEHDQGKAIRVPYSAANYSASGSAAWTVTAGAVQAHDYFVKGNQVTITVSLLNSTMGAGSSNVLTVSGFPFTFAGPGGYFTMAGSSSGGASGWGNLVTAIGVGASSFAVNRFDAAAFPSGTMSALSADFTATAN